jgi:integrase
MSREGSVKKDASGRWRFVIDLTAPGATKRRQVYRRGFKTKREALDALDDLRRTIKTGSYVEPSRLTVEQYLRGLWLPTLAAKVRPTTADTYKRLTELHLIPGLGDVALQQLDRAAVARWVTSLSDSGLSAKSVRNIFGILSKALADAVELELVTRNVAEKLKGLPSVEQRPPRAWTAEQLATFLDATTADEMGALWRFIGTTGCRRGEALGLRWVDVDLDAGTATITQQRTIAGGVVVEGAPKTKAGARTIALDPGTVDALKARKAEQNEHRMLMGAGWPRHGLVFTHADGTGYWPQLVTARFKTVAERLDLPTIGVHGLRHSAATWMIANGVNPRVVQQRLGHAHVSITMSLYVHVLPGHDRDAAEALSAALAKPREHSVITELPVAANDQVSAVRPLGLEPRTCGLRVRCSAN